jgi:hypothetical protein
LPPGQAANCTVVFAVGQESDRPVCGAVLTPELLEELPLEEVAADEEELPLDDPPPELLEPLEPLELLELLDEDPLPPPEDPAAAGPATTPWDSVHGSAA